MINYFDVIKAQSGIPVDDYWAMLWAQGMAGEKWQITTLTGSLPLSFLSKGEALTDYRIYGTENGAGVQTENLVNISMFTNGYTLDGDTGLPVYFPERIATITPIDVSNVNSVVIQWNDKESKAIGAIYAIFSGNTLISRVAGIKNNTVIDVSSATSIYLSLYTIGKLTTDDFNYFMLVKGSTAPDHYIPYGYKIPISNTSGEQQSNYDLFIGDSKLGEDEYLDYGEQKIYRFYGELTFKGDEENLYYYGTYEGVQTFYVELPNNVKYIAATDAPHLSCNYYSATYMISPTVSKTCRYRQTTNDSQIVWDISRIYMFDNDYTNLSDFKAHLAELYNNGAPLKISYLSKNAPIPTDPPVPFPALSTYQGENTLSSEETVGEVSVTGKIKELSQ